MKNLEIFINDFTKALSQLEEGVLIANTNLEIDGTIQRFEFCLELLWKTLKIFLENEGIQCKSPKSTIKEAFQFQLIQDEEIWLEILEDRNLTSHIYDEKESREIFNRIKNHYVTEFNQVLQKLKNQ